MTKLLALMAGIIGCALSSVPGSAQTAQYGGGLSLTVPLGDHASGPSVKPWAYGNGGSDMTSLGSGFGSDNTGGNFGSGVGSSVGSISSGAANIGKSLNALGAAPKP